MGGNIESLPIYLLIYSTSNILTNILANILTDILTNILSDMRPKGALCNFMGI